MANRIACCNQCGKHMDKDSRFCASCGTRNVNYGRRPQPPLMVVAASLFLLGLLSLGAASWYSGEHHGASASPRLPVPRPIATAPPTVTADSGSIPTESPPSLTEAVTICIDPGHPSEKGRGTTGKQITEIQAAWQIGQKLRSELELRGFKVTMTKSKEDEFVKNRRRAEIANAAHAALMVRLHCDAEAGSGFAVYAPQRSGTVDGVRGPGADVIRESTRMGRTLHNRMSSDLSASLKDRGFLPDTQTAVGKQQGALTGSIYSKVPVVLIEMCVLTNRMDEDYIRSAKGQDQITTAIADGIQDAVAEPSSETVSPKATRTHQ